MKITPEAKQYIIDNYKTEFVYDIAKKLNCSTGAVYNIAKKMGLKKPKVVFNDLENKQVGHLKVLKNTFQKYKNNYLWECQCDCGKIVRYKACLLRTNRVSHCGCRNKGYKHHNSTGCGLISGIRWSKIRSHARERGIEFAITIDYVWQLLQKQKFKCAYTGVALYFAEKYSSRGSESNASLDRKDSSLGYLPGNVQWVCKKINFMKQNLSEIEFIKLCKSVRSSEESIDGAYI